MLSVHTLPKFYNPLHLKIIIIIITQVQILYLCYNFAHVLHEKRIGL